VARPLRIDVPGGDKREAQRRYVDFVADGVAASLRARIVGEIYLGDEDFIRALMPGEPVPEVPRPQWQPLRPGLEELCREPGGILVAYRSYGYRLQELADHLGVHPSTVSRTIIRFEQAAAAAREGPNDC
jgi:hypothetical protein